MIKEKSIASYKWTSWIWEVKWMQWNWFYKFGMQKRLMGLKVHDDGCKVANFLEWQSSVASMRSIETNVNVVAHLKQRLEAPSDYILK